MLSVTAKLSFQQGVAVQLALYVYVEKNDIEKNTGSPLQFFCLT